MAAAHDQLPRLTHRRMADADLAGVIEGADKTSSVVVLRGGSGGLAQSVSMG